VRERERKRERERESVRERERERDNVGKDAFRKDLKLEVSLVRRLCSIVCGVDNSLFVVGSWTLESTASCSCATLNVQ
jgi:hypothetical protein